MPLRFGEREQAYRKRLLIISPIATLLVFVLFVTSDVVPYSEIEKRIGWEGEVRLLPQITILPDDDPFEDMRKNSVLKTMSSMDIRLLDEKGPAEGSAKQDPPTKRPDELTSPELDLAEIRHYPANTDVPYAEDYVILHMVQPEYPPAELLQGIEGDVTIEMLVNEDGKVEDAWVLTATGPKNFEHSSLAAVRQFRFKPPMENGRPVPMWIRFQVRFRLIS
ncbi:MAG: energy transducer TonB [Candidatus Krumholzibacteria bacterium]|nr:energy transducer TonB [Candidatus Krumholzibacteria bacterium]